MKNTSVEEAIAERVDFFLENEMIFQENNLDIWLEGASRALHRKLISEIINKSAMLAKMLILQEETVGLLKEFTKPNWDEDGAERMLDESWDTALSYLEVVSRISGFPNVTVDTKGKVCFQWGSVCSKYFLVKFGSFGRCTCFFKKDLNDSTRINKSESRKEGLSYLCSISCQ